MWCYRAYAANDPAVVKHLVFDRSDFMQYAVPGFVFFAQNNLSFLALQHMNSSAFQLLMNTRIVSVAVLAVLVLNKKLHALEWTSIVLLMVGAMQSPRRADRRGAVGGDESRRRRGCRADGARGRRRASEGMRSRGDVDG